MITWGSPVQFESLSVQYNWIRCAVLPNGNFVVAYEEYSGTDNGKFGVYDTSGTEIVTPKDFHANSTSEIELAVLSTGNFFIFYTDITDSYKGQFVIYNSSGSLVKAETQFGTDDVHAISAVTVASDKVLVVFRRSLGGGDHNTYYRVINSDGTFSTGEVEITGIAAYETIGCLLSDGKVMFIFYDSEDANKTKYMIRNADGTSSIQPITISATTGHYNTAILLDNGNVFVCFADTGGADLYFTIIAVNGTEGIADAGTGATSLVDDALSAIYTSDAEINGWTVYIISGAGSGSSAAVTDYVAATGTITVAGWSGANPGAGDGYRILPPIAKAVTLVDSDAAQANSSVLDDGTILVAFRDSNTNYGEYIIYNEDGTVAQAASNFNEAYTIPGREQARSGDFYFVPYLGADQDGYFQIYTLSAALLYIRYATATGVEYAKA